MPDTLTDWFETPTLLEGSISEIQFSLAAELIEPPEKRALVALLKSRGWRRVHRTDGYVYAHPSRAKLDNGAIYILICRAIAVAIKAAEESGDHSLVEADLRNRVARACKDDLQGQIDRDDLDNRFDLAFHAMHQKGKFKWWGFERKDGGRRYTYMPPEPNSSVTR